MASQLQQLVLEPREGVIAAHGERQPSGFDPGIGRGIRRLIRKCRLTPHPELQKNVRRHVPRVARGRRRLGVGAGGRQREMRVGRIVVVVQKVVQCARMPGVRPQHLFENRRHARLGRAAGKRRAVSLVRIHRTRQSSRHCAEQRQRIEGGDFRIVRELRVVRRHRARVRGTPRGDVAGAKQRFDGGQEPAFAFGAGLGRPRDGVRRQARQDAPRGGDVFVLPERLVVGHRLAPVGHRETRIDLLCLDEGGVGVFVFEVVECGDADEKFGVSSRRS